MRLRTVDVLWLVAILAVSFGLGEQSYRSMRRTNSPLFWASAAGTPLHVNLLRADVRLRPILASWAAVSGVLVWVDGFRRRRATWGVGRWAASAAALAVLLNVLRHDLPLIVAEVRGKVPVPNIWAGASDGFFWSLNTATALALVAFGASARIARWVPKETEPPDLLESNGRALLVFLPTLVVGLEWLIELTR